MYGSYPEITVTARYFKPIFNRFFGHSGYVCKDHHDEYIAVVLHGLGMIEELREFRRLEKEAKMATAGNLDNFLDKDDFENLSSINFGNVSKNEIKSPVDFCIARFLASYNDVCLLA